MCVKISPSSRCKELPVDVNMGPDDSASAGASMDLLDEIMNDLPSDSESLPTNIVRDNASIPESMLAGASSSVMRSRVSGLDRVSVIERVSGRNQYRSLKDLKFITHISRASQQAHDIHCGKADVRIIGHLQHNMAGTWNDKILLI